MKEWKLSFFNSIFFVAVYAVFLYNLSGAIRMATASTAIMRATKNSFPVMELKIDFLFGLIYWWWNIKNYWITGNIKKINSTEISSASKIKHNVLWSSLRNS